jgi:Tfp pilus assembly protein PilX
MRRARDEQGFALVTAIMLASVMLGLGLALVGFGDVQQRAAGRQQASEEAFDIAEAALNAQVGELSRAWPSKAAQAYPERCTAATSTATNGCPDPAGLSAAYPKAGSATCLGKSLSEPWGSPYSNGWTTYVRDDVGESPLFNSASEQSTTTAPTYDQNGNEKLWVRATGVARCVEVTLVSLVSRQLVGLNFPKDVASGNWFRITNKGKKGIVLPRGLNEEFEPAPIGMRCESVSGTCEEWEEAKEQIAPNTTKGPPTPTPLLNEEQIEAIKAQAQAEGHFYSGATGTCPKSAAEASGEPAYVEGCGAMSWTGGVGNEKEAPGFLVIADGTLELKGNAEFYGVLYARNPSNYTGAVVSLGGTAQVYGAIDVDGNGGIEMGSSKANLIWNPKAIVELKVYAGATGTRNSFRILPQGQ